ncbi:CaiB/BaiF CoA transferase family protein [Govanella unica]|uniref:CoA transferase n=1 Tax=Govanella unica TaxID=2975056 RepID=A0A9X3Z7W7_9PROT|nr:CaiB/BaiF CoA-transferase family protein [Govania unica]MDA5194463.1 CoA transferase [Govania unica]
MQTTASAGTGSPFGALKGLRVIELGQLIAGPFCGQLMADHGAEVIKIEQPKLGDPMREWGRGKPVWWPVLARNKKSITLDLRQPEGQQILKDLVAKADFLLENFRPGTLEKWGLGYDVLSAINPGLIMIRVSGYGQTGPYAQKAGYGSIGEAMGGMRNLAGDPSLPPSRAGLSIGDSLAATYACLGALMALHHRHMTGRGQVVDSAIYEAVLAMMESTVPEYTEGGYIRERTGSILPKVAPSNVYTTRDGELLIGANQDSVFGRLAEAMGRPELAKDPRYATHHARGEHQAELDDLINDWTRGLSTAEVMALMDLFGVPAGKIFKTPDMLEDPQFKAREALVHVAHPEFRNLMMQNAFPKLSETPGQVGWPGPALGAHNAEIYGGLLGLSESEIAALAGKGII